MRGLVNDWLYFFNNYLKVVQLKLKFGKANIRDPLQVAFSNINNIHISRDVFIDVKSTIRIMDECELFIKEGTYIGPFAHLSGTMGKLIIEENALIAPRVYITTTNYNYEDVSKPIMRQGYNSKGDVIIGSGSWIGVGSCILSGVKIGANSVIGSNSIVTSDIPPYSVAVGSPARVIKQYSFEEKNWLRR